MKCLLIGGSFDGLWREIDTELPFIKLPKIEQTTTLDISANATASYEVEIYIRMNWRSEQTERFIYHYERINKSEVLDMLLEGYKY